ncbi:hypothetical protein CC1G_09957 [Coprinopsis cinerea okayama7|uniref:C2H2-type domain-containing protein n=1 Tax=Coprinopsis cinerea (strain Okayama-7 / 130 / ATCC MYA-4618 / FGSC 9003) TaxID=240176 RepID=A8PGS0_COPC7|nr:hypothetical protein CC1G_09957 [Coprinopsis cinerea okayama7\|eukprot:XP_001841265.1 hypothetical protein CC1G_09957 [Coprinopsis cinerea okayama7\
MDYDSYDRDRGYPYERDRPPYDYGRRGRSRSPHPDEPGRKRRRSLSPYERDRYEPRPRHNDDYDTHSRGYGGYSPRRGHAPPYPPPRRAPPDPHTFDYPATLKQYAEWFRFFFPQQAQEEDSADKAAEQEAGDGSKPRNGIKTRWEKYKKEFAANQLQVMFDHHKKSPWFAEKYDPSPEYVALRTRVRKEGWKGRLNNFLLDLEAGKFDPDLNEPREEPASPIKESANGEGADMNGNAPASADDYLDGDEEHGDHDGGRPEANGKGSSKKKDDNRGDEIAVPAEGNQVMIRTIPPDIGRVKLEEACSKIPGYVYLALGDPLQKRNFYRAGWIRFRDDADMSAVMAELTEKKIDGFKLHVTHNLKPFVNRIRYTPEVASRPERLEKDLANAKKLASILEEEAAKLRAATVSTKTANGEAQQDQQGDQPMSSAVEGEGEEEDPEPKESGGEAVERRIEKVMAELRDRGLVDANDEQAYEAKKTVVSLDLYLAYLRAAFHTCYYCAVTTDHVEELHRKCVKHLRKTPVDTSSERAKGVEGEGGEKEQGKGDSKDDGGDRKDSKSSGPASDKKEGRNDDRWLEWLDSKVALLIDRGGVDPRDYGGKSYEEELSKAVEPYIKQEDEGKFRCKTCQKLFKATTFVEKHIANKHPELVKSLEEIPYFNNFALDPHRIQPFAHPPPNAGTGNNQPPPQAFGIQGPSYQDPRSYYPPYGPGPYPPPYGGGPWDYTYPPFGMPVMYPPQAQPRQGDGQGRRLGDRIGGFASDSSLPAAVGLPPKPTPAALDQALSSGNGGGARRSTGGGGRSTGGPPPPPPPDAKEDPRAAAGKRVSYHDMDLVAEGDVELSY